MSRLGITSTDNGHKHRYRIDDDGKGRTSFDHGHSHRIEQGRVLDKNDHIHTLNKKSNRWDSFGETTDNED